MVVSKSVRKLIGQAWADKRHDSILFLLRGAIASAILRIYALLKAGFYFLSVPELALQSKMYSLFLPEKMEKNGCRFPVFINYFEKLYICILTSFSLESS